MTDSIPTLDDVLADCDSHGIRLALADGGGLTIDAPQDALTPELLGRLKDHKAALLTLLRCADSGASAAAQRTPGAVEGQTVDDAERPAERILARPPVPAKPCEQRKPVCKCGGTTWRDVSIHEGRSVRRDCRRCGRFFYFANWYGTTTVIDDNSDIAYNVHIIPKDTR